MSEPTLQAQIDAANAYEALFVPALFGQWAPKVADAAQIQPGQRALDVACGTGVLARELYRPVFFQFLGQPLIPRDHSVTALSFFLSQRLYESRFNRFVQHLFSQSEQNGVFLPHVADQMVAIQVGGFDESVSGRRISMAVIPNSPLQLGHQ